jgi:hypothetical protein
MSGNLYYENTVRTADPNYAKAYAKGRHDSVNTLGNLNPHVTGTPYYDAYDAGYSSTTGGTAGTIDSCAENIPIVVPNCVGQTYSAAKVLIANASLKLGNVTWTEDNVVSQSPAAAASAQHGATINLTLTYISVPDVANHTLVDATAHITDAGLILGTVTHTLYPAATDLVNTQVPAAAAHVNSGAAVNLVMKVAP